MFLERGRGLDAKRMTEMARPWLGMLCVVQQCPGLRAGEGSAWTQTIQHH